MKRGKPEKYIGLAEEIRQLINSRKLKNNEPLPSERNLSQMFTCSHLTIRKALKLLEQEKLIYKESSKGNFVGSRPNNVGKSGLIGFIFPDDEIFYYKLFAELEKSFSEYSLHPVVHLTHNIKEKENRILEFFTEANANALIAVPNAKCIEEYRRLNIPTIFFDLNIAELNIPHIISDDYEGAVSAMKYLISMGHERIAHIGGTYERTSELRLKGYKDVMSLNGLEIRKDYIKCKEPSREWGYYATKELFQKQPPTAIFCGNDTLAAGALRYLSANGIKIPGDCSLIGFGNTAIAEDLALTSVSQHSQKIADAIRNNLRLLLNGENAPLETIISTTLAVRNSTSKC
ncbi:MAG: GntR family transcriptional regulator [Victivallaceae bacterium]